MIQYYTNLNRAGRRYIENYNRDAATARRITPISRSLWPLVLSRINSLEYGGVQSDDDTNDDDAYDAYNGGNDEENHGSTRHRIENTQVTEEENIDNGGDNEEEDEFQDCHEAEDSSEE